MRRLISKLPAVAFVAAVAFFAADARGAQTPPVVLDGAPFLTELGPHIATLVDPEAELTIDDVKSPEWAARFEPGGGRIPSFGFTRAAVWVRFTLESSSKRDESVILELSMSRMNHFEWFVVGGGRVEQSLACGTKDNGGAVDPRPRFPTATFIVPAGETRTVYARAKSDASLWLPLVMGTPMEFDNFATWRDFWDFSHVGFCVALALLSFGLWLAGGRNRLYLSVAAAMVFGLLQVVVFNGIYAWLGGPWAGWFSYQGIPVSVMLFAMAFARFGQDYFGWDNLRVFERKALRLTYVLCGAAAVAAALIPYAISVPFVLPLEVLALAVPAGVAVSVALRRRGRGMFLFLLAWFVLLAAVVVLVLQFFGAVPVLMAPVDVWRITIPAVFFIFLLSGANAQREVLQMQTKVAALEKAETEARLQALRYQLNPHFLFNTLTSIEELSHEAPSRIPRLVGRLADFLRLRMRPEPSSSITLAQELASVRAYLEIEQVRFEERLAVVYEIDAGAQDCLVPELALMPLVENAIKFGFEGSGGLSVRISARVAAGRLLLRVANNGDLRQGQRKPRGEGVGTRNLKARLALNYGEAASFRLAQEGDLVVAEMEIPANPAGQ